jgi:hypothetical protein
MGLAKAGGVNEIDVPADELGECGLGTLRDVAREKLTVVEIVVHVVSLFVSDSRRH